MADKPTITLEDVRNVLIALRRGGLLSLTGAEIADVGASIGRLEAALSAAMTAPPKPADPA